MKSRLIDAILFVFLAVPGALLFVFSSILLVSQFFWPDPAANVFYLMTFSLLGAILTLIGIRKIREWKYIFVLASFPFSILIAGGLGTLFARIHPALFWLFLGICLFAIPYGVNKVITNYYRAKNT